MMVKAVIARLNELYQKSQQLALNAEELKERDQLRQEYLSFIKGQVKSTLAQIEVGAEKESLVTDKEKHCH